MGLGRLRLAALAGLAVLTLGGLGFLLLRYLNFFDWGGVAALIVVIFAVVLLIDLLSVWARSRLI